MLTLSFLTRRILILLITQRLVTFQLQALLANTHVTHFMAVLSVDETVPMSFHKQTIVGGIAQVLALSFGSE